MSRAGMRALGVEGVQVGSEGCQGVKPDVRPALEYIEGDELVLGRAEAQIGDFDPFEMLLMIPALPGVD